VLTLSSDFSLPVTASFLEFDPAANRLIPSPETLVNLRIGPLVTAFLFLSALAHFLVALPRIYECHTRNLSKGIQGSQHLIPGRLIDVVGPLYPVARLPDS